MHEHKGENLPRKPPLNGSVKIDEVLRLSKVELFKTILLKRQLQEPERKAITISRDDGKQYNESCGSFGELTDSESGTIAVFNVSDALEDDEDLSDATSEDLPSFPFAQNSENPRTWMQPEEIIDESEIASHCPFANTQVPINFQLEDAFQFVKTISRGSRINARTSRAHISPGLRIQQASSPKRPSSVI